MIVMQKGLGIKNQIWFTSGAGNALNTDKIESNWNTLSITAASYTSEGWFIAMSSRVPGTTQEYKLSNDCPSEWITKKMFEEGKMVTALTTSGSQWFTVVTKGSPYTMQVHCYDTWEVIDEFISRWWDKDYYITHATFLDGKWFVVMSKSDLYSSQGYFFANDVDELQAKIAERRKDGKNVTVLEGYGSLGFFCVMSENADRQLSETWIVGARDIKAFTQKWYDQGYVISYLGD